MYTFENVSEIFGLWVYFSLNMSLNARAVCLLLLLFFPSFFLNYIMIEKNSYFSEL